MGRQEIKSNQINTIQFRCWFLVRGENRSTRGKTSRSRVENQETQSTYDIRSGNRTQATWMEGKCSHHCANTATYYSQASHSIDYCPLMNRQITARVLLDRSVFFQFKLWPEKLSRTNAGRNLHLGPRTRLVLGEGEERRWGKAEGGGLAGFKCFTVPF